MNRRWIAGAAALAALLTACSSDEGETADDGDVAAEEPAFPADGEAVELIVPFDAGGITDTLARLLAPELEASLGTTVTVVNRPGAGGQTGLTQVTAADADGYTITFTNLPSVLAYLDETRQASYDRDSFTPIAGIALSPTVFAVTDDSPYEDVDDLVAAAEEAPGSINVGSGGTVTSDDFIAVASLEEVAGVDFNVVTFEGGAADKLTALLGGNIDVIVGSVNSVLGQYLAGEVRLLGTATAEPSDLLEGVPTLESLGYDVDSPGTLNISGPAGMPDNARDAIAAAAEEAVSSPEFIEKLATAGYEPRYRSPEELASYWQETETLVAPFVDEATG